MTFFDKDHLDKTKFDLQIESNCCFIDYVVAIQGVGGGGMRLFFPSKCKTLPRVWDC